MVDQTTLEQKRAEAKGYRGVSYDKRIDKFVAVIMIGGERKHLGSFKTAGDASVIYDQARAAHEIVRPKRGGEVTFMKKALIAFEETAERDANRRLAAGQIFTTPDGQRFRLEGHQIKEKRHTYRWSSRCKICGGFYEINSPMSLRVMTGVVRTCEEHRGKLGQMEQHEWPDPVEWDARPKLLAPVIKKTAGDEPIPASWSEDRKKFAAEYRGHFPSATLAQLEKAHNAHLAVLADAMTPEEKAKYDAMMAEQMAPEPVSARIEDIEVLADAPAADNSDLV